MRPLLSLGIPTYNRAGYLDRMLASVADEAAQLPSGLFEVVVRDNASTDDTKAVCDRYAQRIPGFRYICAPENEGASRNCMAVQRAMEGEWIWMSGDDDFLHPGALTRVVHEIQDGAWDILLLNRSQCDKDEKVLITDRVIENAGDCSFDRLGAFSQISASLEMIGFLGSALYKRDYLDVMDLYTLPSFFNHVSSVFDAFGNRPGKFISAPMLTQRLFNIRAGQLNETTIDVSVLTGLSLLREMLMVQQRGKMLPEELWNWTVRRAYGPDGGSMSQIEWAISYLIKGPLLRQFGVIPDGDYDRMMDFVTGDGRALPPPIYQKIVAILEAAVKGYKARQSLIQA